jgi:hypothetical protein
MLGKGAHQLEHPTVRYPHGGVIQKHVHPSHWDGNQALTRLDRELVVPVSVLVEPGGITQGFD